jgi:hypothetical protein
MDVGFISSPDGGAHWGAPTTLAGPMSLTDIADTSQGPMVGDYISTSFLDDGTYTTLVAIGKTPTGAAAFDEAMYAPSRSLSVATSGLAPSGTSGAAKNITGQGTGETHHALRSH